MRVAGVVRTTAGPGERAATLGEGARVPGVVVVAHDEHRFRISVHLVTLVEPLLPLAEQVREAIVAHSRAAGLDRVVGPIDVVIEDVQEVC